MLKPFNLLRHRAAVAAVPALLAVSLLAVGAAAAPASASIRPACAWQPLSLLNGWQSAQSAWDSGDPMYCVDNGIVYLSGSLVQPVPGSDEFAVLPPQAAPASTLYLSADTFGGTSGDLMIGPDGSMYAYGGNATGFTSLAGVSFPAAQSAPPGQPLSLINGWQSAGPSYGTGDPAYFVSGGVVHLSGSLLGVTPQGSVFATLPPGARPASVLEINVYAYEGVLATLMIYPDGRMTAFNGDFNANDFTSLAGVSFPVAGTAWQPLDLVNGWQPDPDDFPLGTPSYYISGHVVHLDGGMSQPGSCQTGNTPLFGVLPPAARPVHTLYLTLTGAATFAVLRIDPDGDMFESLSSGQCDWVFSLSGISYQLSS
jgi:hypothetical protein